ncbi:MAG: flavodoxin family protein [Longimonas sp.]|uniref:flavodoxin family protein n=1 Tax=Longimonas sp. TaxID=2039626 RepID=UPI00335545D6
MTLNKTQQALCDDSPFDYSTLRALFLNCTLKPSPASSHTRRLIDVSAEIMRENDVAVDIVRPVDLDLAPGVYKDMKEHGAAVDDWPALYAKVQAADILVLGSPIWLGEKSSVCQQVIERLYATSSELNSRGQYAYYDRVGGCLITGNEDGIKHCSMGILYALQHLGYVIPPQADAGWIGEAGPGLSYGDARDDGTRAGEDNDFTQRNTTFMTWNLMHMAHMIKEAGGIPAHGNQRSEWEAGCRFDHPNPEHR